IIENIGQDDDDGENGDGNGDDGGDGDGDGDVEPPPTLDLPAEAMYTPAPGTSAGSSDASTAIALDDHFMIVGDDEANVLRVYPREGGAALVEWSYGALL